MKNDHIISISVIFGVILVLFVATRSFFLDMAQHFPLIMSFIKFFVLATIGDIIGYRLQTKRWKIPNKIFAKAIVWGVIGTIIYLMFTIYPIGISLLQINGVLPFEQSNFFTAFFISLIMNYTFAPTMMSIHRISDTVLNQRANNNNESISSIINTINWGKFYKFTLLKTIPLFWVPAHTITFLLPEEYRILFAALLGIILGILLRFTEQLKEK